MPLESRFCRRLAADSPYVSVSSVVFAPISSATYWFQAVPPGPTLSRRRTSTRVVGYLEHLNGGHQASWIWSP